ncbi:proteophosphoglycan protein [Ceratobasidium sp. AG-Ba]|nr:proteophosphoglycan protein [Ceratobasidium sp. AG-Ba]QRW11289.1 proteophosphoglycan protein [Ceratobasidium sp. AG-Ba]
MSETQTALVSRAVGGIPVHADIAPSVVFAIMYALLLPNIINNFFIRKPRAWNTIQISTVIFAVERIAWCIIRAVQGAHPDKRLSGGLMNYVQVTVGLGFVGVLSETTKLLRCVVVKTTLPEKGASKDRPRARLWFRILLTIFEFTFFASTIPGMVAGAKYDAARNNQELADKNLRLLNVSSGVALALAICTIIFCLSAALWVPEVDRMRCFELAALNALILPVPIYRLCVLHIRTANVFDPLSPSARAIFYIVHLLPEWIGVSILLSTNVRARFDTGRWGDYELNDYNRNKRLEKAKEQARIEQEVMNELRV